MHPRGKRSRISHRSVERRLRVQLVVSHYEDIGSATESADVREQVRTVRDSYLNLSSLDRIMWQFDYLKVPPDTTLSVLENKEHEDSGRNGPERSRRVQGPNGLLHMAAAFSRNGIVTQVGVVPGSLPGSYGVQVHRCSRERS